MNADKRGLLISTNLRSSAVSSTATELRLKIFVLRILCALCVSVVHFFLTLTLSHAARVH